MGGGGGRGGRPSNSDFEWSARGGLEDLNSAGTEQSVMLPLCLRSVRNQQTLSLYASLVFCRVKQLKVAEAECKERETQLTQQSLAMQDLQEKLKESHHLLRGVTDQKEELEQRIEELERGKNTKLSALQAELLEVREELRVEKMKQVEEQEKLQAANTKLQFELAEQQRLAAELGRELTSTEARLEEERRSHQAVRDGETDALLESERRSTSHQPPVTKVKCLADGCEKSFLTSCQASTVCQ
jgi:chromosome segregation ATPase